MQPGDTITPQNKSDDQAVEVTIPRDNPESTPSKAVTAQPEVDPTPAKTPEPAVEKTSAEPEPSPWQYSSGDEVASQQPAANLSPVSWTASEFVDNEKNASWFMGLVAITAVAVLVIYLITRDLVTAFVIIMAATLFGITAKRKPRTLQYQLDNTGVNIGGKPYGYDLFKSFAMMEEGAFNSIQLMPLKRFMPPISLYYPPESEDQIVTTLGSYLPHEERTHDPVERLMRRVRF